MTVMTQTLMDVVAVLVLVVVEEEVEQIRLEDGSRKGKQHRQVHLGNHCGEG